MRLRFSSTLGMMRVSVPTFGLVGRVCVVVVVLGVVVLLVILYRL